MATFPWQPWKTGPFRIDRKQGRAPGTVILSVHGAITERDIYENMEPLEFRRLLAPEAAPGEEPTVKQILDLTECPSIDSRGLGMVVTHLTRCRRAGVKLVLARMSPRVQEVFKITNMDTIIPIADTVEEAENR